jgi:Mrp family chromosome partitioning ATPase
MDATRPVSTDLSQYLGMLRRHWWILVLCTAIGAAGAVALTRTQPKVYRSATSVLVAPVGSDTNVSGGRTKGDINLDTEAQLVKSTGVANGARQLLRSPLAPDELAKGVSVEVPANTSVLVIAYSGDTPQAAQSSSHAFAEAYLRNREASARARLDAQSNVYLSKIRQLNTTLTSVNNQIARTEPGSSLRPNLESQRSTTQNQLNSLNSKLNELTTATITAGEIISDARLPESPSSPNPTLNLATGVMAGLLLGLALALLRERLDRRIRTVADVRQRGRVGVLAALDERTAPRFDDVLQPYGPGGRIFNRLRNEVLASLNPNDQIIVVTGASRGFAATLVAANLATALARTGSEVVLVGAHLPDSMVDAAPLARMLGIRATPGLSDLLSGRVGLSEAIQQAPRVPSLRVITTGGAATAAGLMQSQRLRDTLETLRRQTGYIVIEAPSTSSGADAQSLASLADAAILAVELRRARRPFLLDAAEQLRRVGTPLLGAVVLPRLAGVRTDSPAAQPAVTLTADEPAPGAPEQDGAEPLDDAERTQPLRLPTGQSNGQSNGHDKGQQAGKNGKNGPRQGTVTPPRRPGQNGGADDATAVIDLASLSTAAGDRPRDNRPGDER